MLNKFESNVITELDRIAKALEVTAISQMKQTQIAEEAIKKSLAEEAIKKSQELYKANMAMMKEVKPEVEYDGKIPINIDGVDCT